MDSARAHVTSDVDSQAPIVSIIAGADPPCGGARPTSPPPHRVSCTVTTITTE
ncbi:hypothetical protein J6590_028975 [Homalodisca vitripennis]|nr:hypothetical protein J6590_028975 [Homalodisca vitripennis]